MSNISLKLEMVARTNVGKIRDHNEDNFIVSQNCFLDWTIPNGLYTNSIYGTTMLVADGMGGLNAGEVASRITVDSVQEYFRGINPSKLAQEGIADILKTAILHAHQEILNYSKINPDTEGMGTTAVLVQIIEDYANIAWSGDSRCYLYRNRELIQLTKDHSYVQSLLDEGKINKTQAFYHPQSNIITQSLGDENRPPKPDFVQEKLYDGDILLVCSDGLNAMLEDHTIAEIIEESRADLSETANKLIEAANLAGGNDNITIVLNEVKEGTTFTKQDLDTPTIDPKKKKGINLPLIMLAMILVGFMIGFCYLTFFAPPKTQLEQPVSPSEAQKGDTVEKGGKQSHIVNPYGRKKNHKDIRAFKTGEQNTTVGSTNSQNVSPASSQDVTTRIKKKDTTRVKEPVEAVVKGAL